MADYVIDTTELKSRGLQRLLAKIVNAGAEEVPAGMHVEVMSFGFKRGLPRQADLVFDVRFLPNPFYIQALQRHSGLDEDVRDFVMNNEVTQGFMAHVESMLTFLLPHYL